MENAAADWDADLTKERLCRWQAALFPAEGTALRHIETGRYRTHEDPMQIVSGRMGKERVHYVAPPSAAVPSEMHTFLRWFNATRSGPEDGLVRAGIAHLWFECIHPFEDGNGRVGRAILDLALAQDVKRATRLHGVSSELRRRQAQYCDALNLVQRGPGDITEWLEWFLNVYVEACRATSAWDTLQPDATRLGMETCGQKLRGTCPRAGSQVSLYCRSRPIAPARAATCSLCRSLGQRVRPRAQRGTARQEPTLSRRFSLIHGRHQRRRCCGTRALIC